LFKHAALFFFGVATCFKKVVLHCTAHVLLPKLGNLCDLDQMSRVAFQLMMRPRDSVFVSSRERACSFVLMINSNQEPARILR